MFLWLAFLGIVIGALGTLIGAGGGFILAPILLLMYPDASPETVTSISLAVVFFNALSGSVAYARMRRIDYRAGLFFAAATIPGAVLGALSTSWIPRRAFDAVFGFLLLGMSLFLLRSAGRGRAGRSEAAEPGEPGGAGENGPRGAPHEYNRVTGGLASAGVGYLSSLLGIGGGIIHVPVLVQVLGFPVHVATATSHFVLAIMALTGTTVHVVTGAFAHGARRTIALSIGVVLGAQIGAKLSNRVGGVWILRALAVALGTVGVRILVLAFGV